MKHQMKFLETAAIDPDVFVMWDDDHWVAGVMGVDGEGIGSSPSAALMNFASQPDLDAAIAEELQRERARRDEILETYKQIEREKQLQKRRRDAERRAPNVVRLTF